jgi:FAD synthase
VYFKKKIRAERRFESEEALIRQIASDAETTRRYFQAV